MKVKTPDTGQLGGTCDWMLLADLNQRLCFPHEIAVTNLRPDPVLWSSTLRTVYIIESTMTWEDAVEKAYKHKSLKYAELEADVEQRGWKAKVCPVEVTCRGFVGKSVIKIIKDLGITGQAQGQAVKALSSAPEQSS